MVNIYQGQKLTFPKKKKSQKLNEKLVFSPYLFILLTLGEINMHAGIHDSVTHRAIAETGRTRSTEA